MTKPASQPDSRTTWMQVYFAFQGGPGWEAQLEKLKPSRDVVRRCMRQMEERGESYTALDAWSREQWGTGLHNRSSAKSPKEGEKRIYKACGRQSTRKPFVKLPLDTLVAQEGERVEASFEKGRIIITKV